MEGEDEADGICIEGLGVTMMSLVRADGACTEEPGMELVTLVCGSGTHGGGGGESTYGGQEQLMTSNQKIDDQSAADCKEAA